MSDAVLVGIIAGSFNLLCVVVGRLLSRSEHRATARDVAEIKTIVTNGKNGH